MVLCLHSHPMWLIKELSKKGRSKMCLHIELHKNERVNFRLTFVTFTIIYYFSLPKKFRYKTYTISVNTQTTIYQLRRALKKCIVSKWQQISCCKKQHSKRNFSVKFDLKQKSMNSFKSLKKNQKITMFKNSG